MKFNPLQLGSINESKHNIIRVDAPYNLSNKNLSVGNGRKMAILFGFGSFKNLIDGVDLPEFLRIHDQCVDFIRRECSDCDLYYKPHPVETDEYKSLKLDGFKIITEKELGDMFLYKNFDNIKYVFAVSSTIALTAYSLGLNSYVFYKLFRSAYNDQAARRMADFLAGMPESFYISDLSLTLKENKSEVQNYGALEYHLKNVLEKNKGDVWFTISDTALILTMAFVAGLVKKLDPERKLNLIITHHSRWDLIKTEDLKKFFDNIIYFPKVTHSLNPKNLLRCVKTALAIRRLNIKPGDFFMGVGPGSLPENCLISYFKHNYSIALTTQVIYDNSHTFEEPLDVNDFEIKGRAMIYNRVIEPLLGLHRAVARLRRPSGRNGFIISRYQKAMNDVFDAVYVLNFGNKK